MHNSSRHHARHDVVVINSEDRVLAQANPVLIVLVACNLMTRLGTLSIQ